MSDQKTTKGAVAEARAALATARISLDELEKLRAATRGPPPTLTALAGLLGRPYDGDDVVAVTGTLGLRKRKLPAGGHDVAGRQAGIRLRLDDNGVITGITLFGDGDAGFSAWAGALDGGLNMTARAADVRKALGAPTSTADVDGVTEARYLRGGVVTAFVFGDDGIRELRLRRAAP
jgi:hypothetical protein